MRGRYIFNKYKQIINFIVIMLSLLPKPIIKFIFILSQNIPFKIGIAIRYILLKNLAKKCGDNIAIYENVYIKNVENLSIGNNVSIHPMTYIECGNNTEKGLIINNDISIAHGVTIMSTTHIYDSSDRNIKDALTVTKQIIIESNVWIGAKATILCGNIIRYGSIIGSNAVVTKDTEINSINVGVPSKKIKRRI